MNSKERMSNRHHQQLRGRLPSEVYAASRGKIHRLRVLGQESEGFMQQSKKKLS